MVRRPSAPVRVLVYAPLPFNGQGPAESCAAIVAGFPGELISTDLHAPRFRKPVPAPVRTHPSLPLTLRRLPWNLVAQRAWSQLNEDFATALKSADPASTIAYFWPNPPLSVVQLARSCGIVTVREMINSACATSAPILNAAYARLDLVATHGVTPAKVAAESKELRAYDFLFASNPEVERSLLDLGLGADQILSTTFGWTPERLVTDAPPDHHGGVRMLFVGTVSVRKGVPELLEAWRAARIDGELILAGRTVPELESLVQAASKGDSVRTTGFVQDVGPLFRNSDVFVFPTHEEGGPQVTYEAAGCGLPVITTPMGAARLIETDRTGVVVEPGSVPQLTEAIRLLGGRADLRARYGENARRRAHDFTYRRVAAQRARLLVDLMRSRSPG